MTQPVGRCALVNEYGVVENIVVHNGNELPEQFAAHTLVSIEDKFCGVGFLFNPETEEFIDTREPIEEVVE